MQKRLLRLAWPVMLQFSLLQLTGLADHLMVGQFGERTIAALGICLQLNFLVTVAMAALTQGGAVLCGQLIGAGGTQALRDTVATLLVSAMLVGLIIGVIYLLAGETLLAVLTTDAWRPVATRSGLPTLGYAYLAITGVGMAALVLTQVAMHVLQGLGDTRTPMRVMIRGNLLNVAGNYLLLFGGTVPGIGEPLFPPLGLTGVAIATVAAWSFQAWCLVREVLVRVDLPPRRLMGLDAPRLRHLLKLGYPLSLDGLLWQGAAFAYTMLFNRVGAEAYAAFLIALQLRGFALAPGIGFQQAVSIALSQSLGAARFALARGYVGQGLRLALRILPLLTLLIALASPLLLELYAIAIPTQERVMGMLGIGVLISAATAVTMVIPGVLRAGGDTRAPMVITALGFMLVGLPLAAFAGLGLGWGLWGVFAGVVADEVAKAAMMLVYLRRNTWQRRLVATDDEDGRSAKARH